MALAVMCCGCGNFLHENGSLIRPVSGAKFQNPNLTMEWVSWWSSHFAPVQLGKCAWFVNPYAANRAAKQAGWSIDRGENHRCPDCVAKMKEIPAQLDYAER